MSYGISISNTSGIVQIDDNYENFFIVASGTVTANTSGGSGLDMPTLQAAYGQDMLVFIRTSSYGNNIAIYRANAADFAHFYCQASITLSYVVLVPFSYFTGYASGFGVNVFKPAGGLVFSSNANTVSYSNSVTIPAHTVTESTPYSLTVGLPDTGSYNKWMLMPGVRIAGSDSFGPWEVYLASCAFLSETSFRVQSLWTVHGGGSYSTSLPNAITQHIIYF